MHLKLFDSTLGESILLQVNDLNTFRFLIKHHLDSLLFTSSRLKFCKEICRL